MIFYTFFNIFGKIWRKLRLTRIGLRRFCAAKEQTVGFARRKNVP
jgi:hypothetical protein